MKEIIIKDANKERIEQAIKEAEGRAKERTINYSIITLAIEEIEQKFKFATKKSMEGLEIMVDWHAQKYPKAYRYYPQSTVFGLIYSKGSWRLWYIRREDQNKNRITSFDVWSMPGSLASEIMNNYTTF